VFFPLDISKEDDARVPSKGEIPKEGMSRCSDDSVTAFQIDIGELDSSSPQEGFASLPQEASTKHQRSINEALDVAELQIEFEEFGAQVHPGL
jgi:hypothetical protein